MSRVPLWLCIVTACAADEAAPAGPVADTGMASVPTSHTTDDDEPGDDDDGAPDETTQPSPGCGGVVPPSPYELALDHEGVTRHAIIDLPSDYDGTDPVPLVLNFHGAATTASAHRAYTKLHTAASSRGWIAVHPDGTQRTWDYLSESRDIRFVDALMTELGQVLCLDERRLYATGLSNGGYFSYQLACDRGERIAAIAPVAGGDVSIGCDPGVFIPVLHLHGTDDAIVPYDGNALIPSAEQSVSRWADKVNACVTDPLPAFELGAVHCERWSCRPDDEEATLCTVEGGGHTWPGAAPLPLLGPTNQDIDATEQILDFFARWSR